LAWEPCSYESGASHLSYFTNESFTRDWKVILWNYQKRILPRQLGMFVPASGLFYTNNSLVNRQHTHFGFMYIPSRASAWQASHPVQMIMHPKEFLHLLELLIYFRDEVICQDIPVVNNYPASPLLVIYHKSIFSLLANDVVAQVCKKPYCIFRSPLMKILDWSVEMLGWECNSTGLCRHSC
jgi:hypothetical protein